MNDYLNWPALQGDSNSTSYALPEELKYERGIWGKVHGASSDFRWIACSEKFNQERIRLDRELNLGAEDKPCGHAVFWRCQAERYYAMVCYPSQATDAFGRRGFLEKQILEWNKPPSLPVVLGALLLLPKVAKLSDDIWWDNYQGKSWEQDDFFLPIVDDGCKPLPCDQVNQMICLALQALKDEVDEEDLVRCYASLITGDRPVFLHGLSKPLSPLALAAFLLPLERGLADSLSLAGWIPSGNYEMDELATRWDMLVLPKNRQLADLSKQSTQLSKTAENMVQALLENNAALLNPKKTPNNPPKIDLVNLEIPLENVTSTASPVVKRSFIWPGEEINLSPPRDPNTPMFITNDLYEFAKKVDRRWLDLDELIKNYPNGLSQISQVSTDIYLLANWVNEIAKQRPEYADEEQWLVKVDLIRALAIILTPSPELLSKIGLPVSGRIPALFYAHLSKPDERDNLLALGVDELKQIVQESISFKNYKEQSWFTWLMSWVKNNKAIYNIVDSIFKQRLKKNQSNSSEISINSP